MSVVLTMFITLSGIVDSIENDYVRLEIGSDNILLIDVPLSHFRCNVNEGDGVFIRNINGYIDIICI